MPEPTGLASESFGATSGETRRSVPKERIPEIFERSRHDPLVWAKLCVPHLVPMGYAAMHREMVDIVLKHDRAAFAAPRDHAKSTLFNLIVPMWVALEQPEGYPEHIIEVASSEDIAAGFLRKIKQELQQNQFLRWRYGIQETGKWTESYLELKNGSTIRGLGAEAAVRGRRPTRIFGDDLENDEMVRSESRRKNFEDWFWSALINMLEPEGKLVVTGTILGIHSFLANRLKNPPQGWETRLYAEPENPDMAPAEDFLWPEKWDRKALSDRKAEIGSLKYLQEYCNNPMPDDIAIYKEPWFNVYDTLPVPEEDLAVFAGLDIGCRQKEINDPSALSVFGVVKDGPYVGHIFCLDAAKGKWTVYELIEEVLLRQKRWPGCRWGVETVQFQYAIRDIIRVEGLRRGIGYILTDDWTVKLDKVLRASSNTPLFEQGLVHFRETQRKFVDEMLIFPQGEHDDFVDCVGMAFLSIQTYFRANKVKPDTTHKHNTFGEFKEQLNKVDEMKKKVCLPYGMTMGQLNRQVSAGAMAYGL